MINVNDCARSLREYFSPKIIGEINDVYVKVARIYGEKIPWHCHEGEDEMFLILEGELLLEEEGKDVLQMKKGDMHIVKRGISHRVSSDKECSVLLIENKSTEHTGKIITDITKSIDQQKS
jgi:quercetin dioxygenase-like cupin family protein